MMDAGSTSSPIKKGRGHKKSVHSEKTPKEDEDALQKEKASILNRIKKKLHIKKDDSNGSDESKANSTSPESRRANQDVLNVEPTRPKPHHQPQEDDDMRMYDDSDEEDKYVPSMIDNKHKLVRSGSNKQASLDPSDESAEYLFKGLKTKQKSYDENEIEENDEVLMEKGEEEDFIEELASWGKLTTLEEERREAERRKEHSNNGHARKGRTTADSQSLDEATVSAILNEKLNNLDFKKQKYLLKVLEKLERGELTTSVDPRLSASLDQLLNFKPTPPPVRLAAVNKEIVLRIISNWGDKSQVGLTEIDIFDQAGQHVNLDANALIFGGKSSDALARLVDGQSKTISDKHMWLTDIAHVPFDIVVKIPDNHPISKLKLWNYNKTVKDANKGVQELEVWIGGNCWWRGEVAKGCGNQVFDYATIIPLIQPQPTSHQPHQPTFQKPNKTRPVPKNSPTVIQTPSQPPPTNKPPPSFLTVDGGGGRGGILPRSASNDGKKPMQDVATQPRSMARSLPPKADREDSSEETSSEKQAKPIWLSNGVDDSTLKRQQDLSLDLSPSLNGSDESPLTARKAGRPHSRHSRDLLEKEKEREKEKEKEMSIFGGQKMVKSPSFSKDSSPIFGTSPSSAPNAGPTPRRSRLANSSSDPNSISATPSPSLIPSTSGTSNLLFASNSSSGSLDLKSQRERDKKRVNTLDISESSTDYTPSFRGGEETARKKRDNAYNPSSTSSSSSAKDKQGLPNYSIEQSWENLNFFNVKQMGRIKETKDSSANQSTIISSPSNPTSISSVASPTPRTSLASSTPRTTASTLSASTAASRSPLPFSSAYSSSASVYSPDFSIPSLPSGQTVDITVS